MSEVALVRQSRAWVTDTHTNVRLSRWYSPLPPITPTSTITLNQSLIDDKSTLELPCSSVFEVIVDEVDEVWVKEIRHLKLSQQAHPCSRASSTCQAVRFSLSSHLTWQLTLHESIALSTVAHTTHNHARHGSQLFCCCLNRNMLDVPELFAESAIIVRANISYLRLSWRGRLGSRHVSATLSGTLLSCGESRTG
jgi:hypothetical protein